MIIDQTDHCQHPKCNITLSMERQKGSSMYQLVFTTVTG